MLPVLSDHVVHEVVLFQEDVTARKEAEAALQEKINELEKLNKIKVGREVKMAELKQKLKPDQSP